MRIIIDEKTALTLQKISERYYFDLFKPIRQNEAEEYEFRDALYAISQAISGLDLDLKFPDVDETTQQNHTPHP